MLEASREEKVGNTRNELALNMERREPTAEVRRRDNEGGHCMKQIIRKTKDVTITCLFLSIWKKLRIGFE